MSNECVKYGRAMTIRRLRTSHGRVWLSVLLLLCLLCAPAFGITAQDVPRAAGETGSGHWMIGAPAPAARTEVARPIKSGRTPAAHIGSIMALLATFHEAGVLPPESSREADRLIHALIQSQSLFLKSSDPIVRNIFASALSEKFNAKKAASLTQAFASQGWTSETLEALVDYSASWSPADTSRLAEAFRDYNLSITDWAFVRQVFAKARDTLLKQGKQVHAVFAAQRVTMPGARQSMP